MSIALVVEDSLADKEVFMRCLQEGGISVLTAKTAEEAFESVKKNHFDVIILDVILPDRSGFEICRELKAEAETSQIPVIICSTKGTEMDKFWGMKQGADAYLSKPINREELIQTVNQLIKS